MNEAVRVAAIRLYDLYTHDRMDRREFMARLARLAGGAAAAETLLLGIAANPAAAQIIAADDPRLRTGSLAWQVGEGRRMSGYMAAPSGRRRGWPVVIVIHENRGLNDHIRDVTRRAALAGYTAVAPDWLSGAGGTPADQDRARELIGGLEMGQAVADGVATIRSFKAGPLGNGKVGIVGFCWGGAMVNRLAVAGGAALDAGVSFYGPAPDPAEAARVQAAMLVVLAEQDERVNRTGIPWVDALQEVGRGQGRVFPGVGHAFHNDASAERYNAAAAEQAWALTLMHLARHLRRA